jgi:4,5-dihydroxyphthalate decarboxylase
VPDLKLTMSVDPNWDMLLPVIDGSVKPDGIELEYQYHHGIFYTQLKFNRFDVAEMSFSSFLMARAKGWPFKALPVFVNRQFAWTTLVVRKAAGIESPSDLRGKRVGTGDYQQTAAVWARGALQHEFGVRPDEMDWYMERTPRFSHGGAIGGFKPPPGLRFHYAENPFDKMLLGGELDAAHYQHGGQQVIRSDVDLFHHADCKLLFDDRKAEGIRFFKKHGVFPPHHLIVVRESLLEQHPWIATSLFDAFELGKKRWMEPIYDRLSSNNRTLSVLVFGRDDLEEQRTIFGDDPFPYGIRANAKAIDMMQTFEMEQGLTARKQPLEELFPEEILIAEEKMGD